MRTAAPGLAASQRAACVQRSLVVRVEARSAGGRGAGGRGGGRGPAPGPRKDEGKKRAPVQLPDYGYFAEADTKAPVYAPLAGRETADYTKRGGRWSPEFIWNTNWAEQMDYQEKLKNDREAEEKRKAAERTTGALSLSRVADLDNMDIDLSKKLAKPQLPALSIPIVKKKTITKEVYAPPSQGEARRWSRSNRFAKKTVKVVTTEEDERKAVAEREAENARYAQLKSELQLLNLGLTGVIFGATFAFYPTNVAFSYMFGSLGGAQYLRMLNKSVESYGSDAIGGVVGQQRVLIPVILALGFNRFNELASEPTGITLQLLPILLGFFTYKISVITKSSLALFKDLSTNYGANQPPGAREAGSAAAEDAKIEEIYRDQIMRG